MAITFCGLPLRAHPDLAATLLPWITQTCKTNQTRIFLFTGVFFIIFISVFTFFHSSSQIYNAPITNDNSVFRNRKSLDFLYYDKSAQQMLDYSDPILVDVPLDPTGAALPLKVIDTSQTVDLSYGVVIDCGSSGSRAFIYSWKRHSGNAKDLLQIKQVVKNNKPVVMKITPGISAYASSPNSVDSYLRPLLKFIKDSIPPEKHKDTQLYVLCTAGMRMLTKKHQGLILDKVESTIHRYTDFQFSNSHVEVISGLTEGLYFWLAVNYMYGNLQQYHHPVQNNGIDRSPTFGVLDMGGGSLQIAYEVEGEMRELYPKHVLEIDVGCTDKSHGHAYNVFLDTFLHKGGNAARDMYEKDLIFNSTERVPSHSRNVSNYIHDPCLPKDFTQTITPRSKYEDFTVIGTGDFHLCKQKLVNYLEKSDCKDYNAGAKDCILNSRLAPRIDFNNTKFIGMSEFFYSMDDILQMGGVYDKHHFEAKASEFCKTPWNISYQKYVNGVYHADNKRMKLQCFKSAWVLTVLHQGLNFPDHYNGLSSVQHINGSEVHWSWGAILYKTRFLPLLEIQRQSNQIYHPFKSSYYPTALLAHSGVLIFMCIAIVLFYLLLSLIKFCVHSRGIKRQTLKRVGSSFAHFVNEEV